MTVLPKTRRSDTGQATTETMLMTAFLSLFLIGAVHLSMFAVTRYMVNLAAFSAARVAMVEGNVRSGWMAAAQVIDSIRWWGNPILNLPQQPVGDVVHRNRRSVAITYRVPFGMPIFNNNGFGGIRVRGYAPYTLQPRIAERGDNAAR